MKTFEIPAMGGLMLTTRSTEQNSFFPENKGCFMFDDIKELEISDLLGRDEIFVDDGKPKSDILGQIVLITGAVNVLLVSVSVVALPTRVSVAVGNVKVPVLTIDGNIDIYNYPERLKQIKTIEDFINNESK